MVPESKSGDTALSLLKGTVTPERMREQARMFCNTLRNRLRHFGRRYARQGIDCFRLYDWDSKDIRLVVDWYAGHVLVGEYERKQTGPDYLPFMARAAGQALSVAPDKVHIRRRHTKLSGRPRYAPLPRQGTRLVVRERDLRFLVNVSDYLDTGLFSDHRETRQLVRQAAAGCDVLNLFAYTGAFTCAAAAGGCRSSVSVDRSAAYLKWLGENMALNHREGRAHTAVQSDSGEFLRRAAAAGQRFSLAVVDAPSFYRDERQGTQFDITRDHPTLLRQVLGVMRPGATVFFSTNHQRFVPRFDGLAVQVITPLTPKTIPEDYRNKTVHQCWRILV